MAFSLDQFWKDIPLAIVLGERIGQVFVFAFPVLMWVRLDTPRQRLGPGGLTPLAPTITTSSGPKASASPWRHASCVGSTQTAVNDDTGTAYQTATKIVDGWNGAAYAAWTDTRNSSSVYDVYFSGRLGAFSWAANERVDDAITDPSLNVWGFLAIFLGIAGGGTGWCSFGRYGGARSRRRPQPWPCDPATSGQRSGPTGR